MKNVLVVDDEKPFLLSLTAGMERHYPQFHILTAEHGKEASQILESTSVDLVVTDLRMPVMDGFELLAYMSKKFPSIPAIVISAYGTPSVKDRLKNMGELRFIDKPVDFDELGQAINDGLKEISGGGSIKGISIYGFLQLIEMEQKTCLLEVQSEDKREKGFFYFNKGDLYDASYGEINGREAALDIIAWDNAKIAFKNLPKEKLTQRIDSGLMGLIMESLRRKDQSMAEEEGGHEVKVNEVDDKPYEKEKPTQEKEQNTPLISIEEIDALMSQAALLTQDLHFEQARKLLTKVLQLNPRHLEAWLLLCRISDEFAAIESFLAEAKRIAPNNPRVLREIAEFNVLRSKYSGKEKFRRCPFCSLPLDEGSSYCNTCKAFLKVEGTFLAVQKYAGREILEKAIWRYKRVLEREQTNFKALYYIGIAHINLEQWEEGITHLSKALDLSPHDPDLAEQLDTVLKYLASGDPFSHRKKTDINPPEMRDHPKGKSILVVEDSSTTRMVVSTTLSKEGYRVIEAGDGLEALSKLSQERPDLVLLDIILPKMDGYHILAAIKKKRELRSIPVIMLTGKDKFLDKVKGKMSGSSEYLTKPFEPDELLAAVKRCLKV